MMLFRPTTFTNRPGRALGLVLLIIGIAAFFAAGYFLIGPALTDIRKHPSPSVAQSSNTENKKVSSPSGETPDVSVTETTKAQPISPTPSTLDSNPNQAGANASPSKPTDHKPPFQPAAPKVIEPSAAPTAQEFWKVRAGEFADRSGAEQLRDKLIAADFPVSIYPITEGESKKYIVQVGAFTEKSRAEALAEQLRAAGFDAQISPSH